MRLILFLISIIYTIGFPQINPFHHWHCIDIVSNINKNKPYTFNVGELPLITWFNNSNSVSANTMLNACKHKGYKLDNGNIVDNCIICPYHNKKHSINDSFGKTIIYDNKLWWSYEPVMKMPHKIPFVLDKQFESTSFVMDVNDNFMNIMCSSLNTNKFSQIYSKSFSRYNIPIEDFKYKNITNGIVMSYKYKTNIRLFGKKFYDFTNYQIFNYPYRTSSIVQLNKDDIFYAEINAYPLSMKKSRVVFTFKHNFWKSYFEKKNIEFLLKYIISQEQKYTDNKLNKCNTNEVHFSKINELYKNYQHIDKEGISNLYDYIFKFG